MYYDNALYIILYCLHNNNMYTIVIFKLLKVVNLFYAP